MARHLVVTIALIPILLTSACAHRPNLVLPATIDLYEYGDGIVKLMDDGRLVAETRGATEVAYGDCSLQFTLPPSADSNTIALLLRIGGRELELVLPDVRSTSEPP